MVNGVFQWEIFWNSVTQIIGILGFIFAIIALLLELYFWFWRGPKINITYSSDKEESVLHVDTYNLLNEQVDAYIPPKGKTIFFSNSGSRVGFVSKIRAMRIRFGYYQFPSLALRFQTQISTTFPPEEEIDFSLYEKLDDYYSPIPSKEVEDKLEYKNKEYPIQVPTGGAKFFYFASDPILLDPKEKDTLKLQPVDSWLICKIDLEIEITGRIKIYRKKQTLTFSIKISG